MFVPSVIRLAEDNLFFLLGFFSSNPFVYESVSSSNGSKHGSLTVEELIGEFERMCMRCGAEEDEEQIIARFLGILKLEIGDVVSIQQY